MTKNNKQNSQEISSLIASTLVREESWDKGLDNVLALLGEFAGAEQAVLYHVRKDGYSFDLLYRWAVAGTDFPAPPVPVVVKRDIPHLWHHLKKGEIILSTRVQGNLEDIRQETGSLCGGGISLPFLIAPLYLEEGLTGFLILARLKLEKHDSEKTVSLLSETTGTIAGALKRREHDKELKESEEKYRSIITNMVDYYYRSDMNGDLIMVSPSVVELLGYDSLEDILGKNISRDIYRNPADREPFLKILKEEDKVVNYEVELKKKDGTVITTIPSSTFYYDRDGNPLGVEGVFSDITERKKAEEKLRANNQQLRATEQQLKAANQQLTASEAKFKSYIQNAPAGVFIANEKGKYIEVNKAACEITGYSEDELLKLTIPELIQEEYSEKAKNHFQTLVKAGFARGELGFVTKSGEKGFWSVDAVKLSETRFLGFAIDITERKQAEAEQKKLNAMLNQARKMESVGRLAGGVAHDFNNMLTIINGYAELSIYMLDPAEPVYENLRKIYEAGNRSADIVGQLMAFARKQPISPVKTDLNDTVSSLMEMLQHLIGENIDPAWHPGNNLWPVKMDPSQLDQIMVNLVVNARDAIADVGKITIETKNVVIDEDYCRQSSYFVPGEYVMLAVSDNGCGMEKEIQDNLFEPFFTTKGVGEGTGLGLATIYGIVKQNNSFINVYSEPGEGTTFRIYLPSHEGQESAESEHVKESTQPMPTGSETILLVEDEAAILQMGRQMLEGLGYTVMTAEKPDKALQIAQEHAGTISLLITDIVMPVMNGPELASHLSVHNHDLKTIYMSGYTENAIAHQGVLDEDMQFIQKPFPLQDLAAKVREVVEQK